VLTSVVRLSNRKDLTNDIIYDIITLEDTG